MSRRRKKSREQEHPHADPRLALASADAFRAWSRPFLQRLAGLHMDAANQEAAKDIGGLVASVTTLALSIELYLKALWMLLAITPAHRSAFGKGAPGRHNLWTLYKRLPLGLRKSIESMYERVPEPPVTEGVAFHAQIAPADLAGADTSKSPTPPDNSIAGILKRSSDAFLTWRYLHESGRPGRVVTLHYEFHFLGLIADSLRAHAQDGITKLDEYRVRQQAQIKETQDTTPPTP